MKASTGSLPAFLITIDTEGDNLWEKPETLSTENVLSLPRFQQLCEKYGFKPCYLTNYEMASDPRFREFGQDLLRRGTGEIGMHLHAWNMPPAFSLTDNDAARQPCLIQYPSHVMRDKIAYMTDLLEDMFNEKMVSHRAGRWGFNEEYARLLVERGYTVDCSVTPLENWRKNAGGELAAADVDYTDFPDFAYFIDLDDISRPGDSTLLELPMTIATTSGPFITKARAVAQGNYLLEKVINHFWQPVTWLRPNGRNRRALLRLLEQAIAEKREYVEFMLHSSELMAGKSPYFPKSRDIDALYEVLEELFAAAGGFFTGMTLKGFHDDLLSRRQAR